MDEITHILENVVRCKYFEASVHIRSPIKNSYEDGLGRTTQTLDHVVVVHTLIWDKRKSQINEYSDQDESFQRHSFAGFWNLPSRQTSDSQPQIYVLRVDRKGVINIPPPTTLPDGSKQELTARSSTGSWICQPDKPLTCLPAKPQDDMPLRRWHWKCRQTKLYIGFAMSLLSGVNNSRCEPVQRPM
jgi:hypothetical protein